MTPMNELVSVIVTIYRVEDILPRCIDSIVAQTHQNLEVILVDDGSPDRCGQICDEYAKSDHRVLVIHQKNAGVAAARNAGLDVARGEYITIVDADDWIDPGMIAELLRLAPACDADISVCGFTMTQADRVTAPEVEVAVQEYTAAQALQEFLGPRYVNLVVPWGKLYRRELFHGIRYPLGKVHDDEFTTHRLIHRARRVVRTDAQLYFYWQRPGSITSTFSPERRAEQREAYRGRAAFLAAVGLQAQSDHTYRKAFWMTVRERRRSGDRHSRRSLDREMRGLVREIRETSKDRALRFRALTYSAAPGLVDAVSGWRAAGLSVRRR